MSGGQTVRGRASAAGSRLSVLVKAARKEAERDVGPLRMSARLFSVSDSPQHRRASLLQAVQFVLQFGGGAEHVGGAALIAAVLVVNARRLVCGRRAAFQVMGREPDSALTAEQAWLSENRHSPGALDLC